MSTGRKPLTVVPPVILHLRFRSMASTYRFVLYLLSMVVIICAAMAVFLWAGPGTSSVTTSGLSVVSGVVFLFVLPVWGLGIAERVAAYRVVRAFPLDAMTADCVLGDSDHAVALRRYLRLDPDQKQVAQVLADDGFTGNVADLAETARVLTRR